jgi:predicted nucleic acid-binding protein
VLDEPESAALERFLGDPSGLLTSALALVEVRRAVKIANPDPEVVAETEELLSSLELVAVSTEVLRRAADLASLELRTLDAIHVASAELVGVRDLVTYDRRLADAAELAGVRVASPGA